MVWKEALERTSAYLGEKGVPDPAVAAELLAARLLKCGRGTLPSHLENEVSAKFTDALRRAMARLVRGEPVQYVLGEWDFRSLALKCDRRALIPRPETEELVTRVLAFLETRRSSRCSVVDVGTGTGAIILSIAREFSAPAVLLGTDISEDAIALAAENAAKCGLADRVKLAVADGLDDFDEEGMFDAIVSNPPYIARAEIDALDPRVRDFEPRLALDGGSSGLDFYERYLADAMNLLAPGGKVFFEIGAEQGAAVAHMMRDYGFRDVKIEKDYSGLDRYASAMQQ